jgi:hypothetical protein
MWTLTEIKRTDTSADANLKQRDIIIAFRNLFGDHTEATQGTIIHAVLDEYEISQKFHCFVGNNATSNNGKLIESLNLHPNIHVTANNCIRCAGHIINLVVRATIYRKGVSAQKEQLAEAAPQEQFQLWRKLGVVGWLHNFVNAVCASHKHRKLFSLVQLDVNNELLYSFNTLELCQDGSVCWNSVYLLTLYCLEPKEHINRFIRQHSSHEASNNDLDL